MAPPRQTPSHPALLLAATVLASSLAFVDGSVVNVALPAIGDSLMVADPGDLQWVVSAYLLPLSALLLLGGAAGDRFGRRRVLMAGTLIFAVASCGCALASDLQGLLLGRFTQGVGSALLMPNSLAILGDGFAGERKGRAIGIWAAAGAVAAAVGPVLGGWLVDVGSWKLVFLINLPLAAGAWMLAWLFIPADSGRGRGRSLDLAGVSCATLGLAALTWSLSAGAGRGGWTLAAGLGAAVAAGSVALFIVVERRRGDDAMMPLALFGSRTFVGLTLLTALLYGALAELLVLLPYVLMEACHYSGADAGAALLPFPLVLAVCSPLAGDLAGRLGARPMLALGSMMVAAGFLFAVRIDAASTYWLDMLPALLLIALGMSGVVAPLTNAVLTAVASRHTGIAAGFNSTVARTGGLAATALLGPVLAVKGGSLIDRFQIAMKVGAIACVLASVCAALLIEA